MPLRNKIAEDMEVLSEVICFKWQFFFKKGYVPSGGADNYTLNKRKWPIVPFGISI
jgi:hypothetical protein